MSKTIASKPFSSFNVKGRSKRSRISVFTYLHVLFAMVLGFVFFDERPDALSLLGGALIVIAAVATGRIARREDERSA